MIELCQLEQSKGELLGVIVQYGGQTPLKLSAALEKAGIPILGTSPDSIDLAEDRDRFQELIHKLGLKQPANGIARSVDEAVKIAEGIGYPIVIRPSYVLGGRAMEIVHTTEDLLRYMTEAVQVSGKSPVLIDSFLQDAIEIDADAVSDGENVFVAGIMQHIEEAGIHSGDSACSLPPYSLGQDMIDRLKEQTVQLAKALDVVGLMNVQFAIKGDVIYLIEVNPRASRTVPFVAKATGNPIAKIGARIMAGEKLSDFKINEGPFKHIAVKEAVLPFNRFPGVDTLLGPEMRSTGEVMGLDTDFGRAFAKAQMAAGHDLPQSGKIFMSVKNYDKPAAVQLARDALELGFVIVATHGTAEALEKEGLDVTPVNKVQEGRPHIVDMMKNGDINLVFNTTESKQAVVDSFSIRRTALSNDIPYYTTIAGARATLRAIDNLKRGALAVRPVQEYLGDEY